MAQPPTEGELLSSVKWSICLEVAPLRQQKKGRKPHACLLPLLPLAPEVCQQRSQTMRGGGVDSSRGARRRATAAALSLAVVAVAASTSSSTAFVHRPLTPRGVPSQQQQQQSARWRGVGETATTTSLPADSSLFPGYESFNRGGEGGDLTAGGGPNEVYEYDDFAGFDSAQLAPLDDVSGGTIASSPKGDDGGSTFASSLERRMQQVEGGSNRLVRTFLLNCTGPPPIPMLKP